MQKSEYQFTGIIIAMIIIICWFLHLYFLLHQNLTFNNFYLFVGILIQTHLYTGLFITSHDSIHGVVSPKYPKLNRILGQIATLLFAFNRYSLLEKKHHLHHQFVNTEKDPDVHQGNFFLWWFKFMKQYISWQQIIAMAIAYNVLKIWFPMWNLILFWELPAILSTLQLFYFGTYLPHMGIHNNEHHSGTQSKNHLWAFISCYFFGYHYEHHAYPYLPWWQLPKAKN
jgi:beta-carotene ketolase (CrtW type)